NLTLLDISKSMLTIARSKIPVELKDNVEVMNDDLMTARLESHCFDLIICLGVLAHVDSPMDCIARIVSLLKPNGILIVEYTDSFHFMGRFTRFCYMPWRLFRPAIYTVNLLSTSQLQEMFANQNLKTQAIYRYIRDGPLPAMHRFFGQITLYRLIRLV